MHSVQEPCYMLCDPNLNTFLETTNCTDISQRAGQSIPVTGPSEFERILKHGELCALYDDMAIPVIIAETFCQVLRLSS